MRAEDLAPLFFKGEINEKILPYLILGGLFGEGLFGGRNKENIVIKTYPVKQPEQNTQLSKREIQKIKGKKARKNRGNNR